VGKFSYFLYQKGLSVAKPEFLDIAEFASDDWFRIVETIMKDNNRDGRHRILDQVLTPRRIKVHPKRKQLLQLIGSFLRKGILDERRRVVQFIDQNIGLFSENDEDIFGPLLTAQRDSDTVISITAELAIQRLKGEA
jgi:hypothetical protein